MVGQHGPESPVITGSLKPGDGLGWGVPCAYLDNLKFITNKMPNGATLGELKSINPGFSRVFLVNYYEIINEKKNEEFKAKERLMFRIENGINKYIELKNNNLNFKNQIIVEVNKMRSISQNKFKSNILDSNFAKYSINLVRAEILKEQIEEKLDSLSDLYFTTPDMTEYIDILLINPFFEKQALIYSSSIEDCDEREDIMKENFIKSKAQIPELDPDGDLNYRYSDEFIKFLKKQGIADEYEIEIYKCKLNYIFFERWLTSIGYEYYTFYNFED